MTALERPLVIIVSGDDEDNMGESRWFRDLLQECFIVSTELMACRSMGLRELKQNLRRILQVGGTRPLVIVYSGHGGTNGWAPWHESIFSRVTYEEIASLVKGYAGKILFLNSSCFAMRMAEEFERQGVSADRVGVIAACDSSWVTFGDLLLEHIARFWLLKKVYQSGYMGEAYQARDSRGKTVYIRFSALSRSVPAWWRNTVIRRWYGLQALWRPIEHGTHFSYRWGAQLDSLILDRVKGAPSVLRQ